MKTKYPEFIPLQLFEDFFNGRKNDAFKLPTFQPTDEIIIISDYCGDRPEDEYDVYSFYITNRATLELLVPEIIDFREKEPHLRSTSFIEFKELRKDRVRQRCLAKFLRLFDNKKGIVLTILTPKKSKTFFGNYENDFVKIIERNGWGKWRPHIIRKLTNISFLLVFIINEFVQSSNKLTWYSDRDPIFGNTVISKENALNIVKLIFKEFNLSF